MSQNYTNNQNLSEFLPDAKDCQPNFFILGAAKSGTTSLWMYLKQHPEIYMTQTWATKEPSYFCHSYGYSDFGAYLKLFIDAKGAKARGEASHAYLTSPESAAWIKKVYPEAKFIIVLRNPVERAYSLYNWMIAEGFEWIYPFEKALVAEEKRLTDQDFKNHNPQYYYNYLYFTSGCYSEQIERYFQVFPRQKFYITVFEDLKNNPIETTQKIYQFLDVDNKFIPQIDVHNKSKTPFSATTQYLIKKKLAKYLYKFRIPATPQIVRTASKTNLFFGKFRSHTLSDATRLDLQERYKSDIQKTATLIDHDLGGWLS